MTGKILNKIKKMCLTIGVFLFSISTRVLATMEPAYVVRNIESDILYGPPRTTTIPGIWKITRNFIVPIAFIIGVIIYFKKSKSSTKRKVITIIITLALLIIICFGINCIFKNM